MAIAALVKVELPVTLCMLTFRFERASPQKRWRLLKFTSPLTSTEAELAMAAEVALMPRPSLPVMLPPLRFSVETTSFWNHWLLLMLLPRLLGSTPWASSIVTDAEFPMAAAVAVIEPSASETWILRSEVTAVVFDCTVLTLLAPPRLAEKELPIAAAVRETSSVTDCRPAFMTARVLAQLDWLLLTLLSLACAMAEPATARAAAETARTALKVLLMTFLHRRAKSGKIPAPPERKG